MKVRSKDKKIIIFRDIVQVLFVAFFVLLMVIGKLQLWFVVFFGGVILSLFFGRLYCGWACPMFITMKWSNIVRGLFKMKKFNVNRLVKLKFVRYIFFAGFIGLLIIQKKLGLDLPVLMYLTAAAILFTLIFEEDAWHCAVCPFGTVFDNVKRVKLPSLKLQIDQSKCIACGLCKKVCSAGAVELSVDDGGKRVFTIDNRRCLLCLECKVKCPADAIFYRG